MESLFTFQEPSKAQMNLINEYRLTTAFRDSYGQYLLDHSSSERIQVAIKTIKSATGNDNVTVRSHRKQIVDMLYTRYVLGFRMYEYWAYGLQDKTPLERTEYLSETERHKFFNKLTLCNEAGKTLWHKYLTYKAIPHAFRRDVIYITGPESKKDFLDYFEKHDRIVVKPNTGSLGHGIKIFSLKDFENPESLFDLLLKEYSVDPKRTLMCEEPIIQHPSIAQFHENSVNTLRVFTYFDGVEAHVIYAWMKTGRDGSIVDNGGAGGILAAIDCETGTVFTDAGNEASQHYPVHPNSGVKFKGFKIVAWDEIVACAEEWAKHFPDVRIIGWDIAISEKKGVQLVESNSRGMINLIQIPTRKGMLREFAEKIEWTRYC